MVKRKEKSEDGGKKKERKGDPFCVIRHLRERILFETVNEPIGGVGEEPRTNQRPSRHSQLGGGGGGGGKIARLHSTRRISIEKNS